MPSCRVDTPVDSHQYLPLKIHVHTPGVLGSAVLKTTAFFLVLIPMLMLATYNYFVSLPMIFFFFLIFQFPGAEQWLCECWRATSSSVRN